MGKKLKKIKTNKFWKSIFSNKPLVIFVAVLVLAIVFTNKNISQYFQPSGSEAAAPGWTITQVTNDPSYSENVTDASNGKLVYRRCGATYGVGCDNQVYLYDIAYKTTIVVPKIDYVPGAISFPRIHENRVAWSQNRTNNNWDGSDIYIYNLISKTTTRITNTQSFKSLYDVWQNKVVWLEQNSMKLFNIDTGVVTNISFQYKYAGAHILMDSNKIIWAEPLPSNESKLTVYMYDILANTTTKLLPDDAPSVIRYDMYGDTIAGYVQGPNVKMNIFTYNTVTKKIQQITADQVNQNYSPKLWGNKLAYIKGNGPYQEIHLYDLMTKSDNIVQAVDPSVDGLSFSDLAITYLGKLSIACTLRPSSDQAKGDIYVGTKT